MNPPSSKALPTLRQRVYFVARTVIVFTLLLTLLTPFLAGFLFTAGLTRPGCARSDDSRTKPADWGMAAEEVSFISSEWNQPTPAYFIPAERPNGATIIVVPTGNERRGDRIHEIAVYHRHGYHVLSYDSRSCITRVPNSLGYREVPQVGDALVYLATRAEVNSDRIAIHGFSAGGALALMAAADYPDLRAVVAEGGYHDFAAHMDENGASLGLLEGLYPLGGRLGYRLSTGDDMSVLSPIRVIGQIAPRPILLVYGTNEPSLYGAHLQQAAAGDNATLWEVPGAAHGSYLTTAPEEYERRVIDFMNAAMGVYH
jgi:dienelactone hydrolase